MWILQPLLAACRSDRRYGLHCPYNVYLNISPISLEERWLRRPLSFPYTCCASRRSASARRLQGRPRALLFRRVSAPGSDLVCVARRRTARDLIGRSTAFVTRRALREEIAIADAKLMRLSRERFDGRRQGQRASSAQGRCRAFSPPPSLRALFERLGVR